MYRGKQLFFNSVTAIIYQIVLAISGFIIPHYILLYYGSTTYGLVNSITQIFGIISLCELGIGPVIQAALYKPLADKNNQEISKIFKSANRFFKQIVVIAICFTIGMSIFYPIKVKDEFDIIFTVLLIVSISTSRILQYIFGITRQILLDADQKIAVELLPQIVAVIMTTIISVLLMKFGFSIIVVKYVSLVVYLFRPIFLYIYIKKHYEIDCNVKLLPGEEPIKQKWNGVAQHIANSIHANTDILLLTVFSSLRNVSVYSVYNLVIKAFSQGIESITISITSYFGFAMANGNSEELSNKFEEYEIISHHFITEIYIMIGILILPFVDVYTQGVKDTNYYEPVFAVLLVISSYLYCIRIPYHVIIKAAGHFKQTQMSAIIEAIINLTFSVVMVKPFGIIGVTLGTICAMVYRTIYYVFYIQNNILKRNICIFLKHISVDILSIFSVLFVLNALDLICVNVNNYAEWFVLSLKSGIIMLLITSFITYLMYKKSIKSIVLPIINKRKKKDNKKRERSL